MYFLCEIQEEDTPYIESSLGAKVVSHVTIGSRGSRSAEAHPGVRPNDANEPTATLQILKHSVFNRIAARSNAAEPIADEATEHLGLTGIPTSILWPCVGGPPNERHKIKRLI